MFIEVKTRETEEFGAPSEAVDRNKQRNLSKAALDYLRMLGNPRIHFRFDIVEVIHRQRLEETGHTSGSSKTPST